MAGIQEQQRNRADVESDILDGVDSERRAAMRKLLIGGAFVIPAIATLSMDGLSFNKAGANYIL